ncbi:MAG: aspartate aminotransferase family protein [Archaeoglobus sp.]|nr:aspartate aminotransferase family protein [Archaeoglobus sp.]
MIIDDIKKDLEEIEKLDIDPHTGRLFAYVYETGEEELKEVAREALLRFSEKNILDFTVFKSAIHFEKEVINFGKKLMHADENVVGSFTFGGTESIFLAVKAARDYYKSRKTGTPEIIAPITIHPSFYKAAHYMGLNVKRIPIDDKKKANLEALKEALSDKTALIALSAPNWPYGTIDPIKDAAEIALDKKIPLHVDACLGGFILPFFEKLGEKVLPFDFKVDGVTSISLDAHKYGYTAKGASMVLFRTAEMKKHSMYVDLSSPGYVFVNQAVLSSRSVGPLAAAYAVIRYLGEDGYLKLARKVLTARNKIYDGLRKLGFESVAPVESSVLSMFSDDIDLLAFVGGMREKGWHLHLQKGLKEFDIPNNIHLTISPIHESVAEEFIRDAAEVLKHPPAIDTKAVFESIQKGNFQKVLEDLNAGRLDSSIIPLLLEAIPEEIATELVKEIVIQWYR